MHQQTVWEEETSQNSDGSIIEKIALYLKNRDYFEADLSSKLMMKGYSKDEIERGIAHYKDLGLIDDEELAYKYASQRLLREGSNKIRAKLISKGLGAEAVTRALSRAAEEVEVDEAKVMESHIKIWLLARDISREELDYKTKLKLARRLYNSGFDHSLIKKSLDI